ncbi:MAG TPA: AmmeMemoRadiSam system protein B [Candidatus Dormibacteraeota bacterium]|jgi:AmmeMemoRadiSam system protein B|nr:AmmeMemoRadiSam system protein B [Candidatus Dormibacteraeota bacterium]
MTSTSIRHPAVAGRFYPGEPMALRAEVRSYISQAGLKPVRAVGCIVPHAGYVYAGHVAGAVFSELEVPELCVVICPNHTGMGRPLAIMSEGDWETPISRVPIDGAFATALVQRCSLLEEDSSAHRSEHAIEVELPFLQMRQPHVKFVPIALGTRDFGVLDELGNAIADAVAAHGEPVLLVASSDMNHYESDAITRVKDERAIAAILALDARALYDVVMQEHISMCGFGPAVAMLTAARKLGATSAKLVKYATSGDISGDRDMVVGYAGLIVR